MTNSFTYKDVEYFMEDGKYYKKRFGKKLNVKKRDYLKYQKKAEAFVEPPSQGPGTCEHDEDEDCLVCTSCGQCREDLDSEDLCMDCGGVDENEDV